VSSTKGVEGAGEGVNTITASRTPAKRPAPRGGATTDRRHSDDAAYLYKIIQTIGSGPDLETVLRGIVALLTEATGSHACFIYFTEGDRIVLRAASLVYRHLEGVVTFPIDQGIAGWVARTRRSVFLRDNALDDPRTFYVPELEEEQFQSVASVPIFARAGDVIGVINLHTEAPREFDRADLELLEHTASLVAGAIENARLYENATRQVALLTQLSRLSQDIAGADSVAALLATVTSGCEVLGAEQAEIHLDARRLSTAQLGVDSRRSGPDEVGALASLLWGPDHGGTPLFLPLTMGADRSGLLAVLWPDGTSDGMSVLAAVASSTGVALRHHELVDRLREENLVKDFFEELSRDQSGSEALATQAGRLGCDLSLPHVVLHAAPWEGQPGTLPWEDLVARLESRLSRLLPGVLFDCRTTSCRALLTAPSGADTRVADIVRDVYTRIVADYGGQLTIGLSNLCRPPGSFSRAFEEAASAGEVGGLIKGTPGVWTYEDLGPYRYVLSSVDTVGDRQQERLQKLVDYDARRGSDLLRTLEVYLEGRGNIVGTARVLHTHPNTLRQRLGRIERLCDFDFEAEDWLSLGIAIKIVKLRLARRTAREDDHG
jgi:GAF domain-containing protein/sugar diacid utilization regulator